MKHLFLITLLMVLIVIPACELLDSDDNKENYNTTRDENLSMVITPGTSSRPGHLQITNLTDDTIYIHYDYVNSCGFTLYNLKLETVSGSSELIYDSEKRTWTRGKIYVGCDLYIAPSKILPKKSHEEEIRATLFPGTFKLNVNYSKQMYSIMEDRKALGLFFKIQD